LDSTATAEFSEFAHSRWPALVRLGYGLTSDRGLAEDLAQTALASAYASWYWLDLTEVEVAASLGCSIGSSRSSQLPFSVDRTPRGWR
jgi:hypothetical protein